MQPPAGVQRGLSVWGRLLWLLSIALDYQFTRELGIILMIAHLFALSEKKEFNYFSQFLTI